MGQKADSGAPGSGVWYVLAGSVLWSTGGAGIKSLAPVGALQISAGRSLFAALFFLALTRGRLLPARRHLAWTAAGAVAYAAVVTCFVQANILTTAANAIILQYTSLLWIALFGWLGLREKPTGGEMLSVGLGLAGVALCVSDGLRLFGRTGEVSRALVGDGFSLLSGLAFSVCLVALRRLARTPRANGETPAALLVVLWGNALAAAAGAGPLAEAAGRITPGQWALLAWLGVGQLGLGYWFFQRGLRTVRALTANLLSLVEPVLNPAWAALFVREAPSWNTVAGGALVLASIAVAMKSRSAA